MNEKEFAYFTIEIKPDNLDKHLLDKGLNGWEFVQLIVMQRQVQTKVQMTLQPLEIETKFLLIFKKEI